MKKIILFSLLAVVACGSSKKNGSNNGKNDDVQVITPDFGTTDVPNSGECTTNADCPAERRICEPRLHRCVPCINDGDCPRGYCVDNQCIDKPCKPNTRTCTGTGKARICNADGSQYKEDDCLAKGLECYSGYCVTCTPGELSCKNNAARVCKSDASGWLETPCGQMHCVEGKCLPCVPGARKCQGGKVVQCNKDGTEFDLLEDCKSSVTGKVCYLGQCLDLCKANAKFTTNLGCEYWPVDLQQPPDEAANSPFAVVVGNTNKTVTATITVYKEGKKFKEVKAPPNQATIINLPPYNVTTTMLGTRSWRITSNLPVVAYQFNPLENVQVFSNDASMLMPTNALGRKYMVVAYPQPGVDFGTEYSSTPSSAFVTVVGVSTKPTHVKVTPTVRIMAGNGVQALSPGVTYQFTLKQYEVLNLDTNQHFGDLTGTIIESDHAVAVYSGNMCETVPLETCVNHRCTYEKQFVSCSRNEDCHLVMACDHLEQQLFPLNATGKEYVITKSWPRGQAPDLVRVVAVQNNTSVQINPAVTGIPVLNKGQHYDFEITTNIHLQANNPIMVAKFLEGQDAPGSAHKGCFDSFTGNRCNGGSCICADPADPLSQGGSCRTDMDCSPQDANIGDPAFILGVPVEQYRKKYVFLVPTKYANNYINIVIHTGASVTLDNMTLSSSVFTPIPGTDFAVYKQAMHEGSHWIKSDKPMGIEVYGWDWYVSYGYPGGMNIEAISH